MQTNPVATIPSDSVGIRNAKGRLHLDFSYQQAEQRTILARCEQQPPLRVIRAFPLNDGGALVHLHNVSGGVLGGDQLEISVEVGEQAYAQLTSTSATRLYRSRPHTPPARQTMTIKVGDGGLLEYLPDPLIPFAGSRYQQTTSIELGNDAGLFWWETVSPGRMARGELFAYDLLHLDLDIATQGKPLAIERVRLEPQHRPLTSPARLGLYRYFSSFYICRVGLPEATWSSLERTLSELAQQLSHPGDSIWGVSTLTAHGLIIRALSCHGRDIAPGLLAFWRETKRTLYGREAIPPRKIY
jgi:urease accessory protein